MQVRPTAPSSLRNTGKNLFSSGTWGCCSPTAPELRSWQRAEDPCRSWQGIPVYCQALQSRNPRCWRPEALSVIRPLKIRTPWSPHGQASYLHFLWSCWSHRYVRKNYIYVLSPSSGSCWYWNGSVPWRWQIHSLCPEDLQRTSGAALLRTFPCIQSFCWIKRQHKYHHSTVQTHVLPHTACGRTEVPFPHSSGALQTPA